MLSTFPGVLVFLSSDHSLMVKKTRLFIPDDWHGPKQSQHELCVCYIRTGLLQPSTHDVCVCLCLCVCAGMLCMYVYIYVYYIFNQTYYHVIYIYNYIDYHYIIVYNCIHMCVYLSSIFFTNATRNLSYRTALQ